MITEFNGQPVTYVPPGFRRENTTAMSEGGDVSLARKFLGFEGPPDQLDNFLQSSPAAAARMGRYRQAMSKMGGMRMGAQEGTDVTAASSPLAQMTSNLVSQTMQPIQALPSFIQPTAPDFIPVDAGQVTPIAPFAEAATVGTTQQSAMPIIPTVSQMTPTSVAPDVKLETDTITPAQIDKLT